MWLRKDTILLGGLAYRGEKIGDRFKSRKSWREKLENPPEGLPKAVNGPAKWEKRFGGRRVLVPLKWLYSPPGLSRKSSRPMILGPQVGQSSSFVGV